MNDKTKETDRNQKQPGEAPSQEKDHLDIEDSSTDTDSHDKEKSIHWQVMVTITITWESGSIYLLLNR